MQETKAVQTDIIELMVGLSLKAQQLIVTIKQNTSYKTNISSIPFEKTPYIHESNRNKFLKELFLKDIIKKIPVSKGKELNMKVPKHCYIINPSIIQPPSDYYENVCKMWKMV